MGATALFAVSYHFQASLIRVNEEKRLRNQYQYFLNTIESKKNMAMSLSYLVAGNPDAAEAFARRDRRRLTELLHPAYLKLREDYGIKQFHFHVPPARSFLRLHALGQHGENMEGYRHTINKARQTGTGVGGLERGMFGLGIRGVVPVFHQAKQVGTVEIGLSFQEPLLEEFKQNFGDDLTLYVPEDPGAHKLKVFASTLQRGILSPHLLSQSFTSGDAVLQTAKRDGRDVALIAGPVRDFSGTIAGVVEISVDRGPVLALLKRYKVTAIVIGLIGLALSMTFVWFISVVFTKRIQEVVQAADEIAGGRRETRIKVKGADELGIMAHAINEMLGSLEESRRKIRDYAENLEHMVEERTLTLRESEKTYRTLVENVPLVVYLVTDDNTAMFLNTLSEQTIGVPPPGP